MSQALLFHSAYRGESTKSVLSRVLAQHLKTSSTKALLDSLQESKPQITKCSKSAANNFTRFVEGLNKQLLLQSWDKTANSFGLPNPLSCWVKQIKQANVTLPSEKQSMHPSSKAWSQSGSSRRFRVALSFPGDKRSFVRNVARCLASEFSGEQILYDEYFPGEFARLNLSTYLPQLYHEQSDLICVFLCAEYWNKRWCRLEWRYISQLIETVDSKRIMLLSFDDVSEKGEYGILSGDGYLKIGKRGQRTAVEVAALISKRLLADCA